MLLKDLKRLRLEIKGGIFVLAYGTYSYSLRVQIMVNLDEIKTGERGRITKQKPISQT